jgi:hypothetical protein
MNKFQIVIGAFAIYGMLTIGFSFLAWMNSASLHAENKPDVYLGNFWKWGVIIILLIVVFAFFAGPAKP